MAARLKTLATPGLRSLDFARTICRICPTRHRIVVEVAIPTNGLPALVRFAKDKEIGLTVIGPDDPLAAGIADLFEGEGLRVFGPSKSGARLESAKIFAKIIGQPTGFDSPPTGKITLVDWSSAVSDDL